MGRANSSWDKLFDSVTEKILSLPDETVPREEASTEKSDQTVEAGDTKSE